MRNQLHQLLTELATDDLYDLQERYVLLFDRTRSLSLHLFEHVHGESRDRGQAMIDLKAQYEKADLVHECGRTAGFPAAVPGISLDAAGDGSRDTLGQPAHIFAAMAERLRKRSSPYEAVFRALVALAAAKPKEAEVSALLALPDPDANDLAALDAAWEDEAGPLRSGRQRWLQGRADRTCPRRLASGAGHAGGNPPRSRRANKERSCAN